MRYFSVLIFALGTYLVAADTNKPDFTGHWELNIAKSDFGKMPKPNGMSLDAKVEGGVLKATQTVEKLEGHETTVSEWIEDGKDHPIDIGGPGHQRTVWEGNTLVNDKRADNGEYRQTIRLSLSKDGKAATEKIYTKDPNGSTNATLIWERK